MVIARSHILAGLAAAVAAWLALAALPAQAGFDEGVAALQQGDDATARREFAAAPNDPRAAFVLGIMDETGRGGPVDYAAAARNFAAAAEQGHVAAMNNLGNLYDRGLGVPRDGAAAQKLYGMAAKAGNVMAKNNLAYLWGRQNMLLAQALCLSAETLVAEPRNVYYMDTYGFLLLRLDRPSEAVRYFSRATELKPDYDAALEHLGDAALMRGDRRAAEVWWRRALPVARDGRDQQRLQDKLAGHSVDLDTHRPFPPDNPGFTAECGMPSV